MADGSIDFPHILFKFGMERVMTHLSQCLAKIEKIVYDFDKTWKGTVEDLPPERTVGMYAIYDAAGFKPVDEATREGNAP